MTKYIVVKIEERSIEVQTRDGYEDIKTIEEIEVKILSIEEIKALVSSAPVHLDELAKVFETLEETGDATYSYRMYANSSYYTTLTINRL